MCSHRRFSQSNDSAKDSRSCVHTRRRVAPSCIKLRRQSKNCVNELNIKPNRSLSIRCTSINGTRTSSECKCNSNSNNNNSCNFRSHSTHSRCSRRCRRINSKRIIIRMADVRAHNNRQFNLRCNSRCSILNRQCRNRSCFPRN